MPFQKGAPRAPNAGRKKGSQNKSTGTIGDFARSVVEDVEYREQIRVRARTGALPPAIEAMLYAYAYGKPVSAAQGEQDGANTAFLEELLTIVLKHVTSGDARQEIRRVIDTHVGRSGLRVVA